MEGASRAVASTSTETQRAEVSEVNEQMANVHFVSVGDDGYHCTPNADSDMDKPRFFSNAGNVKDLLTSNGKDQKIPVEMIEGILEITIRCLYECMKDSGRLSVVVTQAKQDSWHAEQLHLGKDESVEEKNQWIIRGYGRDEIASSLCRDGVCRHNPIPGGILRIQDVSEDYRTKDSWYTANGLRAYCGMRLTSLPECTLCALWVGDASPDSSALGKTVGNLQQLMKSLDQMIDCVIERMLATANLNVAEKKIHCHERQMRYVSHEIHNQLAPLVLLNEEGGTIDNDTISNTLEAVFSILKDPTGQALQLKSVLSYQSVETWCNRLSFLSKSVINTADVIFSSHYSSSLPDNAQFYFDGSKLRQAVVNIIMNSQKFTSEGTITWRTRIDRSETNVDEAVISFEIEDTGCGIAECDIESVTGMFVQVGSAEKRERGSGIGLAVTKAVVECLHKGSLRIASKVGVGTTVSVRIPCKYRLV